MTPLIVKARRAKASLRRLATLLDTITVSRDESTADKATARELSAGLRAAAVLLDQAEADATDARDQVYAAREIALKERPRISSKAHPWDARAVVPKRPQGVQ